MSTERRPVAFGKFGGLRLDLPLDEIGGEQAQYLRDVDWDGNTGRVRPRDGFQKLKAAEATGPYKGLFAHSNLRLLATKRIKSTEVKIVAIDKDGVEQKEAAWPAGEATSCFTRFGTPSASYTYCRANISSAKVVRFDGANFTEPTCSVDGVTGKEMPKGKFMAAWPDGGDRLVVANTGATGGPGGAASSNSHVWISEAEGKAEAYESTAYLQINPGDGEEITGLAVFGGQVFVFKETRFFVVYGIRESEEGRPIFDYREVSLGEGSRMKRPVVEALKESSDQMVCTGAGGVYFCTSDGIWVTTGSTPQKISQALRPLEEVSPFDGPMAEFLNGSTESFRWPATGIVCLGSRLIVRRYEFMFILDLPTGEWTCWKMTAVSIAIWTGLTGGGLEVQPSRLPATAEVKEGTGGITWTNIVNIKALDGQFAFASLGVGEHSRYAQATKFGFSVPAGSTIVGVQAAVYRQYSGAASAGALKDLEVRLVRGGVVEGSNLAVEDAWPTGGFAVKEYGGPESLWGLPLSVADVNSESFGFVVAAVNASATVRSALIDAVYMAVYYLTAEAASGVRPRLYCTLGKSVFVTKPEAVDDAGSRDAQWQSGYYDLGTQDEKELVGVRALGTGVVDIAGFTDFDTSPDVSGAHLEFPTFGRPTVLDDNALTTSGVMFSHRVSLEPGSRLQRVVRYVREGRTPITKTD